VWELWPFFEQSNVAAGEKKSNWVRISKSFREMCKAVTYRYWMVGLPGAKPPVAATLREFTEHLITFVRYLEGLGISSMADVRPLHISNYVHEQKEVKRFTLHTLVGKLLPLETLHRFADQ